jgi:group I intron endonuclease
MNIYSIYKATNKFTGKSYIGFTQELKNRISAHKKHYQVRKSKFYDAIKSYGWDNFEWEVIYQSLERKHCLDVMEKFFIEEFDTFNNGYNMTTGGEGMNRNTITEESRKKISDAALRKWNDPNWTKIFKDIECPHCQKVGRNTIMYRWHFDKCNNK